MNVSGVTLGYVDLCKLWNFFLLFLFSYQPINWALVSLLGNDWLAFGESLK